MSVIQPTSAIIDAYWLTYLTEDERWSEAFHFVYGTKAVHVCRSSESGKLFGYPRKIVTKMQPLEGAKYS